MIWNKSEFWQIWNFHYYFVYSWEYNTGDIVNNNLNRNLHKQSTYADPGKSARQDRNCYFCTVELECFNFQVRKKLRGAVMRLSWITQRKCEEPFSFLTQVQQNFVNFLVWNWTGKVKWWIGIWHGATIVLSSSS